MDYIHSFFTRQIDKKYNLLYERLPILVQQKLSLLSIDDQEVLLYTLSRQSEEKINLSCIIFSEQYEETIHEMFKHDINTMCSVIELHIAYYKDALHHPDKVLEKLHKYTKHNSKHI